MLYLSMAVAAWLVWRQGDAAVPMKLFGIQLVFNAAWSWLFFGLHSPGAAFIDIVLLWAAIAATTVAFWRRSTVAGMLFRHRITPGSLPAAVCQGREVDVSFQSY
jgi:translocator protein